MTDEKDEKKERETKKVISDDVERFFKDVWGKVVEYASLGVEEAGKVSTMAKVKVDAETLRFKRGKMVKLLGERYLEVCSKDPSAAAAGTKEILKEIKSLDKAIADLEKQLASGKAAPKKKTARKPAAKKKAPAKTAAKKAAPRRTAAGKKPAEETEKKEDSA